MIRYYVIVNPISGRGTGEKAYPLIEQQLKLLNLDFEMVRTNAPGHAMQLAGAAAASGWDAVVAVGGDGTVNEVLNGLVRASLSGAGRVALGLISVGRGNDFGCGAGVPVDLEVACAALATNHRHLIDIGYVHGGDYPEGRYFGNGVGIGFDAVVGFEALKLKLLRGFPSYIVAALKTIYLYSRAPKMRLEFNGESITQPCLMVSVMNGRRMGGGFWMAPESKIDDGLFDLCIAGDIKQAAILGVILRFLKGTQAKHPAIRMVRTNHLTVTAIQGSLPAHADGETLCTAGDWLEVQVLPGMLEMITLLE